LWNIKWPYLFIMISAIGAEVYEVFDQFPLVDEYGILKDSFKLVSFAMSLLLAFRLNRTYERWKEGRSSLSGVGNGATSLFLQAATWIKDPKAVNDFRRFCIVWPYAIKQVVTSEKTLDPIAAAYLYPEELAVYSKSRKGRQVVVTKVRQLAMDANLSLEQFLAMETVIQQTWKSAGDALRIKFQAMPQGVALVCTGFVEIWCLLLPFSLASNTREIDAVAIIACAVISLLLLACDEVASQMEDPFQLMPVEDIVSTYERDINRILEELESIREATRVAKARLAINGINEASVTPKSANVVCSSDITTSLSAGLVLERRSNANGASAAVWSSAN
jgi:putative membrane protein